MVGSSLTKQFGFPDMQISWYRHAVQLIVINRHVSSANIQSALAARFGLPSLSQTSPMFNEAA